MKNTTRIILLMCLTLALSLALLFALPGRVSAADGPGAPASVPALAPVRDDKIVLGENYNLAADQTLDGNLLVMGGNATLETGSTVTGDVTILGGTLNISGTVDGNIATLGGTLFLTTSAHIQGDIVTMGGTLHRADGARIDGRIVSGGLAPFNFNIPDASIAPRVFSPLSWWFSNQNPLWVGLRFFGGILLFAALAMLVVLMAPQATARVAQAFTAQPVVTGGIGLLTGVVVPPLLVLLALTILLIPVSLLGIVALAVAGAFGWIALGLELGNRIAGLFKTQWHPVAAAGIGTFIFTLLMNSIWQIPCLGPAVYFLVGMAGLGGVVVSRFGTQLPLAAVAAHTTVAAHATAAPVPVVTVQPQPAVQPTSAPVETSVQAETPAHDTFFGSEIPDATPPDTGSLAGPDQSEIPDATPSEEKP